MKVHQSIVADTVGGIDSWGFGSWSTWLRWPTLPGCPGNCRVNVTGGVCYPRIEGATEVREGPDYFTYLVRWEKPDGTVYLPSSDGRTITEYPPIRGRKSRRSDSMSDDVMLGLKVARETKSLLEQAATASRGWSQTAVLESMLSPLGDRDLVGLFGLHPERFVAALQAWGNQLARATHEVSALLSREEWNYLADVCNAPLIDQGMGNPAVYLQAEAEDGHRLNRAGDRWFGSEDAETLAARISGGKPTKAMRAADQAVAALLAKLQELTCSQAWAVVAAIQWFWDHAQTTVDHTRDEWWSLPFRRQVAERGRSGTLSRKPE